MTSRFGSLDVDVVPASRVEAAGAEWALERDGRRLLVAASPASERVLSDLEGDVSGGPEGPVLAGPLSARNAAALRRHLTWLQPVPLGTRTSAGLGDRLGLATPGHVRAVRAVGGAIAPIFPQQSIREMTRTGRTPIEVMDDATWGQFAEGWRDGTGADADHLKTTADIDACLAAGFAMFTIDPSDHVDSSADTADLATLRAKVAALPWPALEDTEQAQRKRYLGQSFAVEHLRIAFDEATLLRALVKYGRAIAHVARMSRHLLAAAGTRPVELEVSVDETDTPTSPAEHCWVAGELRRLGVRWVSLAPRFVGRFEKGVDYIGDLAALEADVAAHAALARHFGPYKLSLHSGSDKFSVYPIAARLAKGLVHLKTAGTSYLEALRTVAAVDPGLFREVYAFARERYDTDKASYHVSAELRRAPEAEAVAEADLPGLLEQFDAREILHVTFGSVLKETRQDGSLRFKGRLFGLLRGHPEAYAANLERHFVRHLTPFTGVFTGVRS
jgi:hypothetical protein